MKEVFVCKFNNKEYISKFLYDIVKGELDLSRFDIDKYNNMILENEYNKYKDYFLNMYNEIDDNVKLDKEQIKAILADEKYSLIIAGAGTGKTTTMASKVKYLVDIKHVDPSKILVMSYTKKATEELESRINGDFNIPAVVTTFHSLAYTYIRNPVAFNKTPTCANRSLKFLHLTANVGYFFAFGTVQNCPIDKIWAIW